MSDKEKLAELLSQKERMIRENKIKYFDPYRFQEDFCNDDYRFGLLMAGNQLGKSVVGGYKTAVHATGLYPDWWEGLTFDCPVNIVVAGKNNEKTRDIIQGALIGEPSDKNAWGTGWIPKSFLKKTVRKPGIPDAVYHQFVSHFTDGVFDGLSKITFLAYDMGKETWMAHKANINWLDEEPPQEILSQAVRSTIATDGIIYMTFTPESGTTQVVRRCLEEWSVVRASWADVSRDSFQLEIGDGEVVQFNENRTRNGKPGHLSESNIRALAKGFMPHELKMRIKGDPVLGSGLVFPYSEEDFKIQPIPIPDHWKRIAAIDFGGRGDQAHATALVWLAYDEATDVIYVYDCLKIQKKEIPEIAAQIITRPQWIPMIWPHDGNKITGQGKATKAQYEELGVNMFYTHFTNPPGKHDKEGSGGFNIKPGIEEISARINDGRIKVFSTLVDLFEEYRQYSLKDGVIIDTDDDLMSALRYGVQSMRHAIVKKSKAYTPNLNRTGGWMGS